MNTAIIPFVLDELFRQKKNFFINSNRSYTIFPCCGRTGKTIFKHIFNSPYIPLYHLNWKSLRIPGLVTTDPDAWQTIIRFGFAYCCCADGPVLQPSAVGGAPLHSRQQWAGGQQSSTILHVYIVKGTGERDLFYPWCFSSLDALGTPIHILNYFRSRFLICGSFQIWIRSPPGISDFTGSDSGGSPTPLDLILAGTKPREIWYTSSQICGPTYERSSPEAVSQKFLEGLPMAWTCMNNTRGPNDPCLWSPLTWNCFGTAR